MGISKTNLKWINKSGETQDLEERLNELELGLDKVESDYLSRSEGGSVEGDLTADSFTLSASGDTYSGFKFYAEGDNVYVAKQKSEGDPEVELIALKTDDELSAESTNPIQNKVVNEAIDTLNSNISKITVDLDQADKDFSELNNQLLPKVSGYSLKCRTTSLISTKIKALKSKINRVMAKFNDVMVDVWESKTWTGLTDFNGIDIWTDGTNIYYSSDTNQYVLDVETSTWSTKTWTGLTDFNGQHIWTDGTNIYHSYGTDQYVLDVETSTWSTKTWNGVTSPNGNFIWSDGISIYFSYNTSQYVLDVETSTWSTKTWDGITYFYGMYVWTDGTNIYYSSDTNQYVLDVETSTWSAKTWNGLTSFSGAYIWTDGTNIYYSYYSSGSSQYVLKTSLYS